MRRAIRSVLLTIEVLICFGPLGVVWLLGVLFFPFWASFGAFEPEYDPIAESFGVNPSGVEPPTFVAQDYWNFYWPIFAAIATVIGLLGVFRWVLASRGKLGAAGMFATRRMIAIGIVGAMLLIWFDPWGRQSGDPEGTLSDWFAPMAQVVCGAIGLVGIAGILVVILQRRPSRWLGLVSLAACTVGIAGLVLFLLPFMGAPIGDLLRFPIDAFPAFAVYCLLPAVGTVHLLYLARHTLFFDLWSRPPVSN